MTRTISNHTIRVVALCSFVFLIILKDFFTGHRLQRPQIFQRTNHSHQIFPTDAQLMDIADLPYVIANDKICANTRHVIIVHSAAVNFDRRNAFRESWANPDVLKPFETKLVFILGQPRDKRVKNDVIKENDLQQDIVMGNFFEDYTNLTLKAVTGLRWFAETCLQATTLFKIDDDVFVDIYKALDDIVPLLAFKPRQLICTGQERDPIIRDVPIFHPDFVKWTISEDYLPGLTYYPMPFCYGFGVFTSGEVARELFKFSKSMPFYKLDDVFIYGMVANKVEGLLWRSDDSLFSKDPGYTLRVFRGGRRHYGLLVGTVTSRSDTLELWELTKQLHKL